MATSFAVRRHPSAQGLASVILMAVVSPPGRVPLRAASVVVTDRRGRGLELRIRCYEKKLRGRCLAVGRGRREIPATEWSRNAEPIVGDLERFDGASDQRMKWFGSVQWIIVRLFVYPSVSLSHCAVCGIPVCPTVLCAVYQ